MVQVGKTDGKKIPGMKKFINGGTDIQCCKCNGWIWNGEECCYDYMWDYYHPQCYVDRLAELEHEYMEEGDEGIRSAIAEEYNDITGEDIEKKIKSEGKGKTS
jgi:hypothetical protein